MIWNVAINIFIIVGGADLAGRIKRIILYATRGGLTHILSFNKSGNDTWHFDSTVLQISHKYTMEQRIWIEEENSFRNTFPIERPPLGVFGFIHEPLLKLIIGD